MYEQQRHIEHTISLVVLSRSKPRELEPHVGLIQKAIYRASPGSYELLEIPPAPNEN